MKKRVSLVLALCMVILIVVAGCSNQQDTGETIETLKVGMAGKDIKTASIIVAKEMGYFEEEGVDVEFETISNLSEGLTAVDMGKLDVLPFGVIPSATFISQGTDVVVFGGTISEGSEIVVTAENEGGFKNIEDFRGKKIGCYRMETGHMVMKGLLRESGMDIENDVTFVLLDSQQSIMEAVRKGEVDAGFLNSGQGYIAQQSGLVVDSKVADFEKDFPCCRQTTSRSSLEGKRDALVKFQVANLRGYELISDNPEKAIDCLVNYSGQPKEYVEAVIYGLDGVYENAMKISLDPNKKKVLDFYEVMKANGDIESGTQYKMEDYIDTSIYEDALKVMVDRNDDSQLFQSLTEAFKKNNL